MASIQQKKSYTLDELKEVAARFEIPGDVYMVHSYGSGHIHHTYAVETHQDRQLKRYLMQMINVEVFKRPIEVMDNIKLVTEKQHESIKARGGNPLEESLTLVNAKGGPHYWLSPENDCWRCYHFIERALVYDFVPEGEYGKYLAYEIARAFGQFQKQLAELPVESLYETIPLFQHTPNRLKQFKEAVEINYQNRKGECEKEIEYLLERQDMAPVIIDMMESGKVPKRVGHNDTKINNVMFDYTGEKETAKVIIDLDTVMIGTPFYDFGDLVRTTTCHAAEDEKDLSKVVVDLGLFEQLVSGFIDGTEDFLTDTEKSHLLFGGIMIIYNQAMRFLGDYLRGDVYYKILRGEQNFDRAGTQIKMLQEIEAKKGQMEDIVAKYIK